MKKQINELLIVCMSTLSILIMISQYSLNCNINKENETIKAFKMTSDGKDIGVVINEEIGEKAVDIVRNAYINNSQIDNIDEVKLNNKINYEEITCKSNETLNEIEVSNKIIKYNDTNEDNVISFTVKKNYIPNNIEYSLAKTNDEVAFSTNYGDEGLYKEVFLDSSIYTPIKGVLTSKFGEQRGGYYHKGIDLAANIGTKIGAALDGVVKFSGYNGGYGNVVMLDHDGGMETVYAHCSSLNVSAGEHVSKGDVIAEVGNTGDSTGPHLHFEIRVNGSPIDPLTYSKANQY